MRIKDLKGFPEKKDLVGDFVEKILVGGHNISRNTIGSLELCGDEEKLEALILKWFNTDRTFDETIEQLYISGSKELTRSIISSMKEWMRLKGPK